jgi:hypothetical protein
LPRLPLLLSLRQKSNPPKSPFAPAFAKASAVKKGDFQKDALNALTQVALAYLVAEAPNDVSPPIP